MLFIGIEISKGYFVFFKENLRMSLKYFTSDFIYNFFNDKFNDFIYSYNFSNFFVSVK
ncbi:hypothetical protein X275_09455 [Marinitoga sp. 1197]|nr:hypothetical protein X275_09455 [Marinitoga sp. 1197]